jgi:anti-sigma28 factor (negative regulator of flagellin synthesis)
MKVYDRGLTAAETGQTQDVQKLTNSAGRSSTRGADSAGDRVEFSGNLGRLSRTLSTFETSQASRVQSLASQYQSGSYHPDSAAISRGMLSEALSAGSTSVGSTSAGSTSGGSASAEAGASSK